MTTTTHKKITREGSNSKPKYATADKKKYDSALSKLKWTCEIIYLKNNNLINTTTTTYIQVSLKS